MNLRYVPMLHIKINKNQPWGKLILTLFKMASCKALQLTTVSLSPTVYLRKNRFSNLSLGDTSTKFGTNDVQDVLSKKSMLFSRKSKMAASFQDGRLVNSKKGFRIFHLVIQTPNLVQMMSRM